MISETRGNTEIKTAIKLPEFLKKPLTLPEKFTHQFARHAQSLVWFILYPLFRSFFKIEINGKEHLKDLPASLIIVSNHVSFYDSFLFSVVLGPYAPQLPLRFMAVNKFDWKFLDALNRIGVIPFIYSLFSVFIVTLGAGLDKNLAEAKRALAHNQSVVIYPEGGLNRGDALLPFRRGASALAVETEKDILPVAFKITKRPWKRGVVRINIGQTFKLERNLNYEKGTEIIYQRVNEIFVK